MVVVFFLGGDWFFLMALFSTFFSHLKYTPILFCFAFLTFYWSFCIIHNFKKSYFDP